MEITKDMRKKKRGEYTESNGRKRCFACGDLDILPITVEM